MSVLRSNSTVFTESRNMLRPVKNTSRISSAKDTAQRSMLLRAKTLSWDSDSYMKSLQGKYEHKESKPPPVVGLGVRRYKGSKSYLGPSMVEDINVGCVEEALANNNRTSSTRKKSLVNGHSQNGTSLGNITEEEITSGVLLNTSNKEEDQGKEQLESDFEDQEIQMQTDVDLRLQEADEEVAGIYASFLLDDLSLDSALQDPDGGSETPHDAAVTGDVSAMKRLIRAGWRVNTLNTDGMTPLQLACMEGHALAVRLLVRHGGDAKVLDPQGRSLLHTAVLGGRGKVLAALLESGGGLPEMGVRERRRGRTPLHMATLENELAMIKMLVQVLKDDPWGAQPLLAVTDKDGRTPLHIAAGRGSVEAAKLLLSVGYSVTLKDLYGNTPMHAALGVNHASKRCRTMLRQLLEAGGDLSIREEHPVDGEDFQAGRSTRGEEIDEVSVYPTVSNHTSQDEEVTPANGVTDVKRQNDTESTAMTSRNDTLAGRGDGGGVIVSRCRHASAAWVPECVSRVERMIHTAARVGCGGCVALLVQYGAPVNSTDHMGRTPLHLAAECPHPTAARTLVRLGATLDPSDSRGRTPLHAAIAADSPALVGALLELGTNPHGRDDMGRSYAEHALFTRKLAAFKCLVERGVCAVATEGSTILHASASLGCVSSTEFLLSMAFDCNAADNGGLTPLHTAIGQGHEDVATLLISEGAKIGRLDNKGATPLHYAVRWGGSDALLRMLVKRGASLSARDRLGRTPLHYAASKFSIMSDLYILLGGGADVNPADISGLTPLHLAARLGNESLVRILLDRGANPTLRDMYNFTPWHHAKENKHASIMKRLEDYTAIFKKNSSSSADETEVGEMPTLLDHSCDIADTAIHEGVAGAGVTMRERQAAFQQRSHRQSVVW